MSGSPSTITAAITAIARMGGELVHGIVRDILRITATMTT